MTSAYASPPPFRIGAADLKGNARRFLERALVISALVHLTAAGVFRAAEERARDALDLRRIPGRVVIVDRGFPPPRVWTPPSSTTGGKGIFEPVDKNVPFPEIDSRDIFNPNPSAIPRERDSGPPNIPGRDLPPPPDDAVPPRVADKLPVVIDAPKPTYPDWAREAGIEGKVVLRVLVGTDGFPKQVVVASGSKALADAARDAVRRWKFEPGLVGKEPVEVWVEVPVSFRLSGS